MMRCPTNSGQSKLKEEGHAGHSGGGMNYSPLEWFGIAIMALRWQKRLNQ
jgi:hypothetical protein